MSRVSKCARVATPEPRCLQRSRPDRRMRIDRCPPIPSAQGGCGRRTPRHTEEQHWQAPHRNSPETRKHTKGQSSFVRLISAMQNRIGICGAMPTAAHDIAPARPHIHPLMARTMSRGQPVPRNVEIASFTRGCDHFHTKAWIYSLPTLRLAQPTVEVTLEPEVLQANCGTW